MSRIIKFRVIDSKTKKIVGYEMLLNGAWHVSYTNDGFTVGTYSGKNLIRQQFTGLLDKNEKEICEGDVVEYATESYDKGNSLKGYKIAVVKDNNRFAYSPWYEGIVISPEVIGNIYENPDLLA